MRQLEREVAALSGAAAGAGVDVAAILHLAAAAASQPDLLQLQADAADAAGGAAPAAPARPASVSVPTRMGRLSGRPSGQNGGMPQEEV